MRLGGHWSGFTLATPGDFPVVCRRLDAHGMSTIQAPSGFARWSDDDCAVYGQAARAHGVLIGEGGFWENLMIVDASLQAQRITAVRAMLTKADIMGCRCVVTLVGSRDPSDHPLAPSCAMAGMAGHRAFREVVLRILDGLELTRAHYTVEPWHNTFFYQPEDIRAFVDDIGHPRFGVHLDQMNLISPATYWDTTALIERTFALLAPHVVAAHCKDLWCDPRHMFLKYDEVAIGDGVLDQATYLRHLATLPPDTPCFFEHLPDEAAYALNAARLRQIAGEVGVAFLPRTPGRH